MMTLSRLVKIEEFYSECIFFSNTHLNNKALKIFICNFLFIISFPENIDYAPKAEAHRSFQNKHDLGNFSLLRCIQSFGISKIRQGPKMKNFRIYQQGLILTLFIIN